jgi:hypothetical protein
MYTSKRIFTKDNINLNYHDYNKFKNGITILTQIKAEDNLAVLNQFNSYQSFQQLSSAYFPFIDNNTTEISYIKNIYDDNQSFTIKNIENNNMCKNVLYPYGKIFTKKNINPQFPTKIELCKWCNEEQKNIKNPNKIDEVIIKNCNLKKCKKSDLSDCNNDEKIKEEISKIIENVIKECNNNNRHNNHDNNDNDNDKNDNDKNDNDKNDNDKNDNDKNDKICNTNELQNIRLNINTHKYNYNKYDYNKYNVDNQYNNDYHVKNSDSEKKQNNSNNYDIMSNLNKIHLNNNRNTCKHKTKNNNCNNHNNCNNDTNLNVCKNERRPLFI